MIRPSILFSSLVFMIVLYSSTTRAVIRHVPSEWETIQAAIDVSSDGDIVELAPGYYQESFTYSGKAITVRSSEPGSSMFNSPDGNQILIEDVCSGTAILDGICFTGSAISDGGIKVSNSIVELRNIDCVENISEGIFFQGRIVSVRNSTASFMDCSFRDNVTSTMEIFGGGIVWISESDITMDNCIFDNNRAYYCLRCDLTNLVMNACTISNNHSLDPGGGIDLDRSFLVITESVICGNQTGFYGGGIYMSNMKGVIIGGEKDRGNRFYGNTAEAGEDVYDFSDRPVMWNAQYNEFSRILNERLVVPFRCFDLRYCSYPGTGITQDVYVSSNGSDDNDGLTPQTAFRSLTHAMDLLTPQAGIPLTVHLYEGIYSPALSGERFPIPLYDNVYIVGAGFERTIIDAGGTGKVMTCHLALTSSIQDITLTGGNGKYGGGFCCVDMASPLIIRCALVGNYGEIGGGAYVQQACPTFMDCDISVNSGDAGGGIYSDESPLVVVNCRIQNNTVLEAGGGVYVYRGDSELFHCVVSGNTADRGGGLRFYNDGSGYVSGCRIFNNTANEYGGGVACLEASPTILNSLIINNRTDGTGGGIDMQNCRPEIINVTVAGNSALSAGSGISCINQAKAIIHNSIVYENLSDGIDIQNSDPVITFTNSQNAVTGEGNISSDPLFVDGPDDAYRLAQRATGDPVDSPCVDSGGEFAADLTFKVFGNTVALSQCSTRSDSLPDTGISDMGYHGLMPGFELVPSVQIVMELLYHPGMNLRSSAEFTIPGS